MNETVYLNGRFLPLAEAKIAVSDYGFLFGYGLFETMRAYEGRVFRLSAHLKRLADSASRLGIGLDVGTVAAAVAAVIERNALTEARVRITVSAGIGSLTPDPGSCGSPTLLVYALKYHPYPPELYLRGFRTIISSLRRNSRSPLATMKSSNYLESMLAKQEAKEAGAEEAILLNDRGRLAEAAMSNLFLVKDKIVRTPGKESGILPGITRAAVLELALARGLRVLEGEIMPEELFFAEEVFVTNSLIEIMPVTMINDRVIGCGKPGPITGELMQAYRDLVQKETGR